MSLQKHTYSTHCLPMDIVHDIFTFLHPSETKFVSKKMSQQYKQALVSATCLVQRHFRRFQLVSAHPYDRVTFRTLKRFYVTKYRPEWLRRFTQAYVRLVVDLGYFAETDPLVLKFLYPTEEQLMGFVKNFYDCCIEFNIPPQEFEAWGW